MQNGSNKTFDQNCCFLESNLVWPTVDFSISNICKTQASLYEKLFLKSSFYFNKSFLN